MRKKGLICLALAGLLLTGCNKSSGLRAGKIENNTLFIDKKGTILCGIVESFDKEYYSEEELENFLNEEIEAYNTQYGEGRIELSSFAVEDKTASMVVKYQTIDDYVQIHGTRAGLLTYEEVSGQSILPESVICMADGSTKAVEELEVKAEDRVLLLTEEYDVILEGEILYYQGCASRSNDSVHTSGAEESIIIFK